MAPTFHLVCGSTGAGKTTYSLALAQRLNAVRFSIDEWMVGLFAKDKPEPMQFAWVVERVERCEDQIGRLATQMRPQRRGTGARPFIPSRQQSREFCIDCGAIGIFRRAAFSRRADRGEMESRERTQRDARRNLLADCFAADLRLYGKDLGAADACGDGCL
jgi:hypothetical protein